MRRFLKKCCLIVAPVWLATLALLVYYTQHVEPNMNGEMGPLGKLVFPPENKENVAIDTFYYTNFDDEHFIADTTVDVLTVGDSFSQQSYGSYENFLALGGLSVINFHANQNMFQTAYDLMNLGLADSAHVKTIVVESVERFVVQRLTSLVWDNKEVVKSLIGGGKDAAVNADDHSAGQRSPLIETKNFLLLRLGVHRPVRHCRVDGDFFTGDTGRNLYFLEEDLTVMGVSAGQEKLIQDNIRRLTDKADSLGIRLVFMLVPDKYDVYQHHIVDNPYAEKTVTDDLRRLLADRSTWFMARDVVLPLVEAGEQDVYPLSCTHWSYRTARQVAADLAPMVKSQ